MSEFDLRARTWDNDKMHIDRSAAIAKGIEKRILLQASMKVLEYGAGTGILSFMLKDKFAEITLMDNSQEMIKVCHEKCEYHHTNHIFPVVFDLEHQDLDQQFDLIYTQMVMHHVDDTTAMISKFYDLLNPEGYLAIADLFSEDGSFHGPGAKVHLGFDPEEMTKTLTEAGFKNVGYETCFVINRPSGQSFPVFLLTARK
ncbi:MAG: class I SAM-dependent methyltransferase [Prolixibacteraceae bacterium]|jgi:2-polyprenyl-3-methyl-5-hydroxy-6-metoxy-1,4-benzoquinol methylase